MNNSIKGRNSKEVIIQLNRADVQKNTLIKNIYKEYEIYFKIVRKIILNSAEKGIFGLYSDLSISDKAIKSMDLNNFLSKNIRLLINSKLPLITIEQLKLRDISDRQKQSVNLNTLKELLVFKECQAESFDSEIELITKEPLEFYCNNNLNKYEYYESLSGDDISSINLDEGGCLNSFSKNNNNNNINLKKNQYEKVIDDSDLKLIEESNEYSNINDRVSEFFISRENLEFFEIIDKSFSQFLLTLSYKINSELFKINLIKNFISEDSFKYLSNNKFIIKHPYPCVIKYELNLNKVSIDNNKPSNIHLFNITNVELEFYNIDLSNCRNNINELKNRFRLLDKKQRYWEHKNLNLNNLN